MSDSFQVVQLELVLDLRGVMEAMLLGLVLIARSRQQAIYLSQWQVQAVAEVREQLHLLRVRLAAVVRDSEVVAEVLQMEVFR
jgi:hypothetical protein